MEGLFSIRSNGSLIGPEKFVHPEMGLNSMVPKTQIFKKYKIIMTQIFMYNIRDNSISVLNIYISG